MMGAGRPLFAPEVVVAFGAAPHIRKKYAASRAISDSYSCIKNRLGQM